MTKIIYKMKMNSFLNILAFFALFNINSIQTSPIPNEDDQQKLAQENEIEGKPKILQAVLPGGFGGGGMIPPFGQMYPNQGMMPMPPYPGAGQYPGMGMGYPGMGYPGQYPGMGAGQYPGMGYPNQYPGMGQYPGMAYPGQFPGMGMGYPGMPYPGMGMGYPGQYPGMGYPGQGPYGFPYNPYGGIGGGFPSGGGIQTFNPLAPNPLTPMAQKKLKK